MTSEEFDHLLALLDPDREQAAVRYVSLRPRLVRFFEWKGCTTPEELTDEVMDRVARKAAQPGFRLEKPDPTSYFLGVARRVALEHLRKRKIEEPIDPETEHPQPVQPDPDPRLFCVHRCLKGLSAEDRQLLLDFHTGEDRIRSRQKLADRLGCTSNALRIRVHRVRNEFKKCLATCLAGRGE